MKTSRYKTEYRATASKLHKRVGNALKDEKSPFSGFKIYQEYPVNKVWSSYQDSRHKFDWVVLDICLVIEAHGEQHYKPVTFGGVSLEEAEENLIAQQYRDTVKAEAAIAAGFTYVAIPYSDYDKISPDYLWSLYQEHRNDAPIQRDRPVKDLYKEKQKELARRYRQEQYRYMKKWRSDHGT